MATDPVTSPQGRAARLAFGAGCGALSFLLRVYGRRPEAPFLAVALMNMFVPLLERLSAWRRRKVKTGDFPRVLWRDNPLLVYLVGLCPALAVSNRLVNALLLGAVMLFALLGTGVAAVGLERLAPPRLRLPLRLLLASALVSRRPALPVGLRPDPHRGPGDLPAPAGRQLPAAGLDRGEALFRMECWRPLGRGAAFAAGLALDRAVAGGAGGRHGHAFPHRLVWGSLAHPGAAARPGPDRGARSAARAGLPERPGPVVGQGRS